MVGLNPITTLKQTWLMYTPKERRNIAIYIGGIMLYKFGLEAFNGSLIALATNRYDYEALQNGSTNSRTFERVNLLTALYQTTQCIGSILIAPLVKRFPTKNVLACGVTIFAFITAILLIVDAATGGSFMPAEYRDNHPEDEFSYYGTYNTDGIIPIYCVAGIGYGMVELIRRVIPRDIVGGNVEKLRRMDALVHVFYEIAGTGGAFCTALGLIPYFGNNYSFIITPICFLLAAITWFFIHGLPPFGGEAEGVLKENPSYLRAIFGGFWLFGESVFTGGRILLTSRKYVWLLPGYAVALYAHRYLESSIGPLIARRYLRNSAWSQIMVGGSNFGELLGALFVFLFTNLIPTPIPWLRLDALMLLIVWYLPYWYPPAREVGQAWIVAATFIPISFGWASGDVSLAAYIQASLARIESKSKNVSALGAVMAFLYCTYIVTYAIVNPLVGRYVDSVSNRNNQDVHEALVYIAGVHFTIVSALVIAATFIPKGAIAFNPKMVQYEELDNDLADPEKTEVGSLEENSVVKKSDSAEEEREIKK